MIVSAVELYCISRGVLLHGSIGMHQNMIVDILRVACVINPICLIHICVAPVTKRIQWEATSSYRKDKNNRAECTKCRSRKKALLTSCSDLSSGLSFEDI